MISEKEMNTFIRRAVEGDKDALGTVLESVQDMVFNLSLRMMGMIEDAEDATQEIMIRVMTSLSSFKGESLSPPGFTASPKTIWWITAVRGSTASPLPLIFMPAILSRAWLSAVRTPSPGWTPNSWPRS